MSTIELLDEVLGLAQRAAIAPPEDRAVLLAEIDARLSNARAPGPELEALLAEVRRIAAEAA